jgi:hypothetical protein
MTYRVQLDVFQGAETHPPHQHHLQRRKRRAAGRD